MKWLREWWQSCRIYWSEIRKWELWYEFLLFWLSLFTWPFRKEEKQEEKKKKTIEQRIEDALNDDPIVRYYIEEEKKTKDKNQ